MFLCFVDRCMSFCTCSFGHFVVCSSSIYSFWLPFGIFKLFSKFKGQSLIEMTFGTMRLCHCIVCHTSIVLSVILPLYCLSSFHMRLSITLLVCLRIYQKKRTAMNKNNIKQSRSSIQLISTNINETCLTFTELTEHKKDDDIWRWKSRIWLGTGIKCGGDNGKYGIPTLASWKLFTILSKNNSELDSKVLQTLEFVEVVLPLFFWLGLSTSLSTWHVLGHIMFKHRQNWQ